MSWWFICDLSILQLSDGLWCLRHGYNIKITRIVWSNDSFTGLILDLRPGNGRWRYFVTTNLIGWRASLEPILHSCSNSSYPPLIEEGPVDNMPAQVYALCSHWTRTSYWLPHWFSWLSLKKTMLWFGLKSQLIEPSLLYSIVISHRIYNTHISGGERTVLAGTHSLCSAWNASFHSQWGGKQHGW